MTGLPATSQNQNEKEKEKGMKGKSKTANFTRLETQPGKK